MHFELSNMPTMSCRCVKTIACARPLKRRLQADELLTALSPLLDEVDGLRGDETPREAGNIPVLLEENARLRKLAVKLSNLLGDLPERGT